MVGEVAFGQQLLVYAPARADEHRLKLGRLLGQFLGDRKAGEQMACGASAGKQHAHADHRSVSEPLQYLDTDNTMPTAMEADTRLVPPALMKGSVRPVHGMQEVATAMLARL